MRESTKRKLSLKLRGNTNALGKPKPKGFGAKISEILSGQTRTEEQKRRISEGKKGHIVSDETKEKISQANKGRKRTAEQKKRMAAAQRRRYAEKRKEEEDESQDRAQLQDSSGDAAGCISETE